jgi:CHASE3 domain sensor protein
MLAHLVDQETGERGYVITGDAKFLEPYTDGEAKTTQDLTSITRYVGGVPAITSAVSDVERQWQTWLTTIAEPEIAARQSGSISQSQQLVDRAQGKTVFDELRNKVAALQQDIAAREALQRQGETSAIARLERTVIVTSIGVALLTLLALALVFSWVLRP